MSGDDDIRGTFKRCRSAIDVNDPTLKRIAHEINFAEMILVEYLNEVSGKCESGTTSNENENAALDHLSRLIVQELRYLKKVKSSEVVSVVGNFATFRGEDGEYIVTVVPEEELQRSFQPLFRLGNIKPRFAKPVPSSENCVTPSSSGESIYYDASSEFPSEMPDLPSETSAFGKSIYGMLNYIFASTIGKMEKADLYESN